MQLYLVKQGNSSYTEYKQSKLDRLHCSSCGDITDTSLLYPFYKITSSNHNNIMAFEIRYYNANS